MLTKPIETVKSSTTVSEIKRYFVLFFMHACLLEEVVRHARKFLIFY
jgi:hypothetical protein